MPTFGGSNISGSILNTNGLFKRQWKRFGIFRTLKKKKTLEEQQNAEANR
jgi:hypothetical protein